MANATKTAFAEIKNKLEKLDTTSLCDVNKQLRVFASRIRPLDAGTRMVGKARTVRCKNDFLTVIQALIDAQADEVLVIDGQGGDKALLGELISAEARRKGLTGIVCDGAVRDVVGIKHMGFPVFTSQVTPMAGTCANIGEINVPISCGGIEIRPGDIIFGDDDGLIAVDEKELLNMIEKAEAIQRNEAAVLIEIQRSKNSLIDLTNVRDHIDAISKGRESKLQFNI